jgi:glycerophosphoryl diester phosphodiesterase
MSGAPRRAAPRRLVRACALGVLLLSAFASGPAHAKFHIVAHRGGRLTHPENTLVNFAHAIEIGVDWSETDSWLSKDGVPVLHHDLDMCRTTNIGTFPGYDCTPGAEANNPLGRFRIRDFDAAELKLLDVGSWFSPAFAGEPMPTLAEALQLVNGTGMPLLVELKVPAQALKVRQILIDYGIGPENIVAWARNGEGLAADFRTNLPEVRRMIGLMDPRTITEANLAYWAAQGDFGLCVQSTWLTQEFVDLAHSYGLVLYTLPAGTTSMPVLQQVDLGVDYFHATDAEGAVALAASLHCFDGLDNDDDGLVDFPDDPGCTKRSDTSEIGQCQDGLDNDGAAGRSRRPGLRHGVGRRRARRCRSAATRQRRRHAGRPADPDCASAADDRAALPQRSAVTTTATRWLISPTRTAPARRMTTRGPPQCATAWTTTAHAGRSRRPTCRESDDESAAAQCSDRGQRRHAGRSRRPGLRP